jgi:hypothetical protein
MQTASDPFGILAGLGAEEMAALLEFAVKAPPGLFASDDETCSCGGQMRCGADALASVCADCGIVVDRDTTEIADENAPRGVSYPARLRIVGPGSSSLQPDLYRSGAGTTPASQQRQIFEELKVYRARHIEAGGRAFPLNACEKAAEYYGDVQRECVKRSQNKKAILACCLWRACLTIDFAPTKAEIAAFMQLPSAGIARGEGFVRAMIADGKMSDLEANVDPSRPEITTLFAHLGYDGEAYAPLREAVYRIVQLAVASHIGVGSTLRSKVAGAGYAVLSRAALAERATGQSASSAPLTVTEFCGGRIRKNTVEKFTKQLEEYHSRFVPIYEEFGLDARPTRERS